MKSFIVTQRSMRLYETTIRDLDVDEMRDFIIQSFRLPSSADIPLHIPLRSFTTKDGENICVVAPSTCDKKLPISYRFKGNDGREYVFRGNVAVCGIKDGEPSDHPSIDKLLEGLPVEPIYKDDAICIPSITEWMMIPLRTRRRITPSFWIWTRTKSDQKPGRIIVSGSNGGSFNREANEDAGGITPFINLRQIPEDTAEKMRELMGRKCSVELTAEGYRDMRLVKVSRDVYACASNAWGNRHNTSSLRAFDKNGGNEYKDCSLREFLNGEYLGWLTDFFKKAEIIS